MNSDPTSSSEQSPASKAWLDPVFRLALLHQLDRKTLLTVMRIGQQGLKDGAGIIYRKMDTEGMADILGGVQCVVSNALLMDMAETSRSTRRRWG